MLVVVSHQPDRMLPLKTTSRLRVGLCKAAFNVPCVSRQAMDKVLSALLHNLQHSTGRIYGDIGLTRDYRGRPRMMETEHGMVAADHGRCSDLGKITGELLINKSMLLLLPRQVTPSLICLQG